MDKKAYDKQRYMENKVAIGNRVKKYYQENKVERRLKIDEWCANNKNRIKAVTRKRYAKDSSTWDKARIKYRKNNPEQYTKSYRITNWKGYGIISNDWDKTYDHYINTHYCEYCDEPFKNSGDRNLDHDHDIDDDVNIRGILCKRCNFKDVFMDYFKFI